MLKNKIEHIAFILDGNKRWAKKNNLSLSEGYKNGLNNINNLIKSSIDLNIPFLTIFTLSSENLHRTSVNKIFQVIYDEFSFFFEKVISEKKVKIKIIGSKNNLPNKIINLINHCEIETKKNTVLNLTLAFNYGFKNEILNVINLIYKNNSFKNINENNLRELFYLGNLPDPDILVRTGGNKRLSNFIMYNLIYTEIYFIEKLWPDFSNNDLIEIINDYKTITRTYGL